MRVFTTLPMRDWHQVGPAAAAAEAAGFDAVMTAELAHDAFAPLALSENRRSQPAFDSASSWGVKS